MILRAEQRQLLIDGYGYFEQNGEHSNSGELIRILPILPGVDPVCTDSPLYEPRIENSRLWIEPHDQVDVRLGGAKSYLMAEGCDSNIVWCNEQPTNAIRF